MSYGATNADWAAFRHILAVHQEGGRWKAATVEAISQARAEGIEEGFARGYEAARANRDEDEQ